MKSRNRPSSRLCSMLRWRWWCGRIRPVLAASGAHGPHRTRRSNCRPHRLRRPRRSTCRNPAAAWDRPGTVFPSSRCSCPPICRAGGDGTLAAGLAVVLGHHLQQVDRARRLKRKARQIRKIVLVGTSRWTSFISSSRPTPIIPWRRFSSRRCANGAARSKAGHRANPAARHQGTHRQGDERHHPARDRRHRDASWAFWPPWARSRPSSACSARCGAS